MKDHIEVTYQCIVRGCYAEGNCIDKQNYTQQRTDLGLSDEEDFRQEILNGSREIWYCNEHAIKYLHPMIDMAAGNTTSKILNGFREEGLM